MLVAAVLAAGFAAAPSAAHAGVFISARFAPPVIPIYEQPLIPGDGYIWTPGYWAWDGDQYSWVDGAWVFAPYEGALWTPGYWGWGGGLYFWNAGYWGRRVGYYGGINYGFGYFGTGFYGGYWNGGHFFYNGVYNHLGGGIHNIYNRSVPGVGVHPGGSSFVRTSGSFAANRGTNVNGNANAARTPTSGARPVSQPSAVRGGQPQSAPRSTGGGSAVHSSAPSGGGGSRSGGGGSHTSGGGGHR